MPKVPLPQIGDQRRAAAAHFWPRRSGCGGCRTHNEVALCEWLPKSLVFALAHESAVSGGSEGLCIPTVIAAGMFSTIVVVPAGTLIDCNPLEGETAVAAPPFTESVPPTVQLGMRTLYTKAFAALMVVVRVSLNG